METSMSVLFSCPDCFKELSNGHNNCECGWFNISKPSPPNEEENYQCRYLESGIRCKNIGTLSRQIKGNFWYCKKHSKY